MNPSTGRFLNRDPINEPGSQLVRDVKKEGDIGEELNRYLVVRNNPPNFVDHLGFFSSKWCWLPWVNCDDDEEDGESGDEESGENDRCRDCEDPAVCCQDQYQRDKAACLTTADAAELSACLWAAYIRLREFEIGHFDD